MPKPHKPMSALPLATVWLALLLWLPLSICRGAEIVGPLNDVTGVNDLRIAYDGTIYVYDVSFVTETYSQAYPSSPPTFAGNFEGAQLAATQLAYLFETAGVTGVLGADPFQAELLTPYDAGASTGFYQAEETDFVPNRSPSWIPVGPGCCEGSFDSTGTFVVYQKVSATSAPEPGTLALLALGLTGLALTRRRSSLNPGPRL
jgi:hypothetical protein